MAVSGAIPPSAARTGSHDVAGVEDERAAREEAGEEGVDEAVRVGDEADPHRGSPQCSAPCGEVSSARARDDPRIAAARRRASSVGALLEEEDRSRCYTSAVSLGPGRAPRLARFGLGALVTSIHHAWVVNTPNRPASPRRRPPRARGGKSRARGAGAVNSRGPMNDRLFISALRLVPKNALSRARGRAHRWHAPAPVRLAAMKAFARRYGIDLSECPDLEVYRTFGEFFARPLRPGLRPIAPGETRWSRRWTASCPRRGSRRRGGSSRRRGSTTRRPRCSATRRSRAASRAAPYATLYLSPQDYHRIHFPLGGSVTGWRYVPGRLWPVNPASVRTVPGLFAVNERLVTVHRDAARPLRRRRGRRDGGRAASAPATIRRVPHTNRRAPAVRRARLRDALPVEKGQELGAFEMGSTVILLFEPGRVRLDPRLVPGARVRVGEPIGGRAR